jgi:predicted kinase
MSMEQVLIMVMGLPGVGKSYFAKALASRINGVHLNSDLVRKEMLKTPSYTREEKARVYDRMFELVCQHLEEGRVVVVDATFSRADSRKPYFEYIGNTRGVLKIIRITADEMVVTERLKVKRPDSDADYGIYQKIKAEFEEMDRPFLSLSSTALDLEQMIDQAMQYIRQK